MSACESYLELISAHLDGALADDERARLTGHLASCEACRAYMAELAAIRAALSNEEDVDVPDGFADGVMQRVRESAQRPKKQSALRRFAPLAACAALLAVVFAGGIGFGGASGGTMAGDAAAPESMTVTTADSYSDHSFAEEDEGLVLDGAYADEEPAQAFPAARDTDTNARTEELADMVSAKGAVSAPMQLRVTHSDALEAWLSERGIPSSEDAAGSLLYTVDAETVADFAAFLDESGIAYTQEADAENAIVLEKR